MSWVFFLTNLRFLIKSMFYCDFIERWIFAELNRYIGNIEKKKISFFLPTGGYESEQ